MGERILRIGFLLIALRSHPTLRVASSQIIRLNVIYGDIMEFYFDFGNFSMLTCRLETFPFDDDVFHYRIPVSWPLDAH